MEKQNKFIKCVSIFGNTIIFFGIIFGYSIVMGADASLVLEMERFNQQSILIKEIAAEREQMKQSQLEKEILQQKLRKQGIPSTLIAGRDQPKPRPAEQEEEQNNSQHLIEPKVAFNAVMEELVERHGELYEKILFDRGSMVINDYCQKLLTPEILEFIPPAFIQAQAFNPSDKPFTTAIKLERLGLVIKDLCPPVISPEIYERRRRLMGKCFALAGSHVDKAVRILREDPSQGIDFHTLIDMYQTGGLLYHWAAMNMPNESKNHMDRLSENFYNGLKMIQQMLGTFDTV